MDADIRIHVTRRLATVCDVTGDQLAEWQRQLGDDTGCTVELHTIGDRSRHRSVGPVEWIAIFIGTNVATSLISGVTADLYAAAKRFIRTHRRVSANAEDAGRGAGFVIHGPDGGELARWDTRDDGETPGP